MGGGWQPPRMSAWGVWHLEGEAPAALATEAAESKPYWTADNRELFAGRRDTAGFRWRVEVAEAAGTAPRLERMPLPVPPGFHWLSLASNQVVWTTAHGSQLVEASEPAPDDRAWKRTASGMSGVSPDGRWLAIYRGYTPVLHVYHRSTLEPAATLERFK